MFRVEASHESVFYFVCVAQDVALVELQNIGEIIHSSYEAIHGARLDDMLPLSPQEFLIEYFLQYGRTHFYRCIERLAVGRILLGAAVHQSLAVVGFVKGQRWTQRPSMKLHGQGNLRAEIEARQQIGGAKAGLAPR